METRKIGRGHVDVVQMMGVAKVPADIQHQATQCNEWVVIWPPAFVTLNFQTVPAQAWALWSRGKLSLPRFPEQNKMAVVSQQHRMVMRQPS